MNKTFGSLVAATSATAALSLITLAAASPSAAPARGTASAAPSHPASIRRRVDHVGRLVATAPAGKTIAQVSTTFTVPTAKPSEQHRPGSVPGSDVGQAWTATTSPAITGASSRLASGCAPGQRTGAPEYALFWEMAPAAPQFAFTAGNGKQVNVVHVAPGNTISVIVSAPGESEPFFDGKFHMLVSVTNARGTAYYRAKGTLARGAVGDRRAAEVITELPTPNPGTPKIGALDTTPVHYSLVGLLLRNPKDAVPEPYQLTRADPDGHDPPVVAGHRQDRPVEALQGRPAG